MATTVFDRETLLDLLVNGIPLFILLFFIAVFFLVPAFGLGGLATGLQFAIVGVSFVALLILTYVTGKAVTLAERTGTVYLPGQATVRGSKPIEEREAALHEQAESIEDEADAAGALSEGESDGEDDELDEEEANADEENEVDADGEDEVEAEGEEESTDEQVDDEEAEVDEEQT